MTAEEVYESVTKRAPNERKKDELDLLRLAEAHPEVRGGIPWEIVSQLPNDET